MVLGAQKTVELPQAEQQEGGSMRELDRVSCAPKDLSLKGLQ